MKTFLTVALALGLLAGCGRQSQTVEAAGAPAPEKKSLVGSLFSRTVEVSIPAGTALRVRLGETLSTSSDRAGEEFTATLDTPVVIGEKMVLPKGTTFRGSVISSASSGRLRGRARMALTLDSFDLNGQTYKVSTSSVSQMSSSHKKRNWLLIGGGSGTGAAIGALAGGGTGALIGAGAGAAAGTAGAVITGKRNVQLPVESLLTFSLNQPVQVKMKS
jgi:hypothetical protein